MMKKFGEENLKMIGAKVPTEFAEKFSNYCKENRFNQRELFYNIFSWWFKQNLIIQEHIYRGRMDEAISLICSAQAAVEDENAAASASSKSIHKKSRRRISKSG